MAVPHDEHERTFAFADIALGQIRALGQPVSPRNFEIWYNYATGYNAELNKSINDTLAKNGALSEVDLEQVYNTFIATTRVGERIDSVGSRVLDEIRQECHGRRRRRFGDQLFREPCRRQPAALNMPRTAESAARRDLLPGRRRPRKWKPTIRNSKPACRRRRQEIETAAAEFLENGAHRKSHRSADHAGQP